MRAILQPHDIRHRTTAMRTHLAVPRRILRALLRRQLRQDLHRRIQQPAPTRRAETEHIPLIHPPAPSAAHRILGSAPHPPAAAAPAPDDTPDIDPNASASHARSTDTLKDAATTSPGSPPPAHAKALKATYKRSPSPGSPPSSGHHSVRT